MTGRVVRVFVLLLVIANVTSAAPKKGKGDSLFGGLSKGNAKAREIIESLNDDTRKMLAAIRKAAGEGKASRSRMVDRWNNAIAAHSEEWNRKIDRARAASGASIKKDLGGARSGAVKNAAPSWPADWKRWGDAQYRFFSGLKKSPYMEWLYDTRKRIEGLEDSKEDGPKIINGYVEMLEDISEDIRKSRERLDGASSKADVQKERRKFIRIWTAVRNLDRSVRARKKRVEDFFARSDTSVDNVAKGVEVVKKWSEASQAKSLLDPMCKSAAKALVAEALFAVDDYRKARKEVLGVARPLLDGTLFQKVKGFESAGLDITAEAEKYEKLLQLKEASFR